MFEHPENVYQKALEKVERLRSETLSMQETQNVWRQVWAQWLRGLADRLEPKSLLLEDFPPINLPK